MEMQDVLVFATIISPVILALVELVKGTFPIRKNFVPLAALVLGLVVGYAAMPFTDLDLTLRLWAGGLAGLAATGLFELVTPRKG
jgi:hypothetical protein